MSLMNLIKEDVNARKIFGERELKIIEKQLLGVKLTQSEKNRLSRDIRKKFNFIKEASKYQNEFDLKKSNDIKKITNEIVSLIKQTELFPKIKRIVLFGSVAEKEQTLISDMDIAVEFEDIDSLTAFKFRSKLSGLFSRKVDIQVYNMLPEKIRKEIDERGKLLYLKK